MNISKLSVTRPVTIIMVFLGVILLGLISWSKLPQELFPSIAFPQITVVTPYLNAAPEEIESLVTKVIEEAVGTVNNVKRITSISKEGLSLVSVEFNWGSNMDFAALSVREKIDLIKEKLPRESQEPIVMKYNPFDLPILNLAVTGQAPPLELREICRKYIKDAIEKVEGVASATITGGDEREILVGIDQPRLRASQISIVSVVDSIRAANINYPAGTIKESFYEYLIRTMGEYQKIEEIRETPAALDLPEEDAKTEEEKEEKQRSGRRLVYLKDIARVKDTIKEKTSISRHNGRDSISIVIRKQSGTNTLNVVKGVRREIKRLLTENVLKGVDIRVTYDQSQFIQEAISNVRDASLQGAILAFIVLFLFLWEFRSSVTITFSIPISIMATFCLMYFSNINLNMMSLGGLALGVGMLVDNSIVVIENIFRHRHLPAARLPDGQGKAGMQKGLKQACIDGAQEMVGPIFGSTLTTVAVFLPFAFVVGIIGQVFKQLSLTITFSLMVSIVVALTLVPMLISLGSQRMRLSLGLEQKFKISERKKIADGKLERLNSLFAIFISKMMGNRIMVVIVVLVLFLVSLIFIGLIPKQFLPRVDQRQFIIKVDLPPGSRLETTDTVVKKIERILLGLVETQDVTVNIGSSEEKTSLESTALQTLGSHQAQLLVNLKKKARRLSTARSTDDVIQYLKNKLEKQDLEDAVIEYIAQETSFGSAVEQGAPIAIEIQGPDLNTLTDISSSLQNGMNKINGIYGIKSSMPSPSPETKLNILKDKASLYGLSVRDIAITAQVALKGYVASRFKEKEGQEDVDIRVRLRPEDRSDLSNLRRLLIHSPLGMDVSLSDVAYLTKGRGPTEIQRIDQQRTVLLTANTYKRNFNQILKEVNKTMRQVSAKISKDYSINLTGEQQRMKESFRSLAFALVLAFILVYMIMAGEFESLWQPFLIMFTIPLSLIGVAFALLVSRTPLSSIVYLGIIMLGGIAVNNGIVLIDFINVLKKEGLSNYDAVIQASKTRLRPILMTSLTTILGLLPLALGMGEGAELQAPLAITVMGGLTSATFLTLIFIPALYLTLVERIEKPLAVEEPAEAEAIIDMAAPVQEAKPEAQPTGPIAVREKEKPAATPPLPESAVEIRKEITVKKKAIPAPKGLNIRQKELLEKLKEIKKVSRKDYARMFNISVPTASRDLKELTDKGLLKAEGPLGPGRWYELC